MTAANRALGAVFSFRRVPIVQQAEAAECGIACLAMVSSFYGQEYDLSSIRNRLGASSRGVTLSNLMAMASSMSLAPRALRLEVPAIRKLQTPCILHWDMDHFVVLEKVSRSSYIIADPAVGRRRLTESEFSSHFTGVALELTPTESFEKGKQFESVTLGALFKSVRGLRSRLFKLLLISAAIQSVALLMPIFSQLVIDEVIVAANSDMLLVLALAFGMLALTNAAFGALRSFAVLYVGAHLQMGWGTQVFHHLMRLPLEYFERRHMGDVLSRFKSLSPIQNLTSTAIVESIIDGMMAATTLALMLFYSPLLALIPVTAVALYIGVRCAMFGPQRENSHETIMAAAREDSHILESLRGILAIKSFSAEAMREALWGNKAARAIRTSIKESAYKVSEGLINQTLLALENVFVISLGAMLIIKGEFTVGMLVAFMAYRSQFTSRLTGFVDKLFEFRLLRVHLDRLSDILMTSPEPVSSGAQPITIDPKLTSGIEVKGLGYRYSLTDPWILRDVSFSVNPGECIGIAAPSGSGKTTLIKLMMGLLRPSEGSIVVDGFELNEHNATVVRGVFAAVMQEDMLLSGSLADNISFFDPSPDQGRIRECARLASIAEDIDRMPMGLNTLIGDMGASLSGGQKQRILLARALYAKPRILFLDEATSHMDPEGERRIHDNLRLMKITRVVVAHRRETLEIADRVIQLQKVNNASRISEVSPQDESQEESKPMGDQPRGQSAAH